MRKLILTFALVLVANMGMAQANDTFKKDVMKMIEVTGSANQMKVAKDQILKMVPKEKQAAFLVEFDATLPALYDKMAELFMQEYTQEDVKAILKFYESPIGKKMSQKSGVIAEKSMTLGQEWAMGLQGMMMKYMQ
ncbi:hypothetical protein FEDK69T_26170 [Flavobacterium enshiense DK69]|uniref:DUF2059 domain-containing protein n=1 Tax=Flavobacterium enshiense DK69 TaxID=1107311 RepID=V6S473_9FLAO|nr:DUF2059 domain-containing protein [Flavobacterium enshiense]ESU21062.1 hypothetical protein FEDK69T_26170 [Flavobacterium enshiense DK69]KGO95209.1 hypothetical protein Q767_12135 [Flavobacterium enshiense DK69]